MKWEPTDVIRLVALIGAMLLFALGAFMMWQGIVAEGAIDIKSSVLSGSVKTGSAGLFIAFLSFAVIVFVLFSLGRRPVEASLSPHDHSKSKRAVTLVWALLVGVIVTGGMGALGFGQGFSVVAAFLGFMLFIAVVAFLTFLENEQS